MDPDSVPGPDGYGGHFFRTTWDFISGDVVQAVRSFFISDRLAPIAAQIIFPNQFAFLKGRHISDCIHLASECINLLDNICDGGNVAIKFDLAKAFDTLSWDFLTRVPQAFGFHSSFVQWISFILHSAHLSILFNGSPVGFFSCSRGVRQGDPLSPLLFCIIEEVLSRGDKRGLRNLMAFMDEYGLNSGQYINKQKSRVYIGKAAFHRRSQIVSWLGVNLGDLPFIYLGVPHFRGRPKRVYFQSLADRVRQRMSQWQGLSLSMAGRVALIKSVVISMLSHGFSVYRWPSTVLVQVRNEARTFIWTGCADSRGFLTVSWKRCCAPLNESGLGVRNFASLNQAFLLKFFWEILVTSTLASSVFQ
ncbi:hypothetical protein EV2_025374 [Malus domestica]